LLHREPPPDIASTKKYVDEALSITMHAMKAAIHSTLGSSPESLTFNRDMFLNIPLIADWHSITQRHEHLIIKNLIREKEPKALLIQLYPSTKGTKEKMETSQVRQKDKWTIQSPTDTCKWYLTVELRPGISERPNIRRVIPYKKPAAT
jgi:hypothetical protein